MGPSLRRAHPVPARAAGRRRALVDARPPQPVAGQTLPSRPDLPPEQRALMVVAGAERWVDAAAAVAAGYTLVDFGDDWTPFIFQEVTDANGNLMANRYRQVYLGLAGDTRRSRRPAARRGRPQLPRALRRAADDLGAARALPRLAGARRRCADVDFAKLKAATVDPAARRQGRAEVRGQDRRVGQEARGAARAARRPSRSTRWR